MSNDLLFSVLPRRGTVAVKTDRGNVKKVAKKTPVHASRDEENLPLIGENLALFREKESRHQSQEDDSQAKDYSDEHVGLIIDTTDESVTPDDEPIIHSKAEYAQGESEEKKDDDDDDGPSVHLDITV
ncbi:hypothetical protein [Alteromonas facilis]|uniref:hypothetical protein n=1 Tax=Alteromonas facilis TaxID=2048004 RepID=UPI000F5C567B|nr:hypothetical protein [Alteromonas facilis]